MRPFSRVAAGPLLSATSAFGLPATDITVKQRPSITNARKLLDTLRTQMDANLDVGILETLQGKQLAAKQQAAITRIHDTIAAPAQNELTSSKLIQPLLTALPKNLQRTNWSKKTNIYVIFPTQTTPEEPIIRGQLIQRQSTQTSKTPYKNPTKQNKNFSGNHYRRTTPIEPSSPF